MITAIYFKSWSTKHYYSVKALWIMVKVKWFHFRFGAPLPTNIKIVMEPRLKFSFILNTRASDVINYQLQENILTHRVVISKTRVLFRGLCKLIDSPVAWVENVVVSEKQCLVSSQGTRSRTKVSGISVSWLTTLMPRTNIWWRLFPLNLCSEQ